MRVTQSSAQSAGATLRAAIVRACVLGVPSEQILAQLNQNATSSDARKFFEGAPIGNLYDLQDHYETQRALLRGALADVTRQRAGATLPQHTMHVLLDQNLRNERALTATLVTVTHELRGQIVAYEVRLGAIASQRRDLAGEQRAVAAASAVGGQAAVNAVTAAIEAAAPPASV